MRRRAMVLVAVLLALTAGILSCAPVQTGPRVWIDFPLDGSKFFPETTVSVTCHAFSREGVAEVQLAVNGEAYRLAAPAQPGEQFAEISMEWLATEPGDYVLSVVAFDMTGAATNPDRVSVTVVGEPPDLILNPTPVESTVPPTGTPLSATATGVPPTFTPPSTGTPRPPTVTREPPTATPTPPRPTIVSFQANPRRIMAGECSRLSWAVEGVISAVYFEGEGVGDHDSRQRCPDVTRTYTLRAEGPGGEDTATVRVNVTEAPPPPPPDTEGPLIQNEAGPQEMWAPDGNQCRGLEPYQFQANVSDVSGVLWVKLIYSVDGGPDQSGGMQLVSGTTYRTGYSLPDLGGQSATFEWHIRGCDMVDPMNCSDSATHTESMFDCPI